MPLFPMSIHNHVTLTGFYNSKGLMFLSSIISPLQGFEIENVYHLHYHPSMLLKSRRDEMIVENRNVKKYSNPVRVT